MAPFFVSFDCWSKSYDPNDQIDSARYGLVNALLCQPLNDLVANEEHLSAREILDGLDKVQAAVEALSH
jgi:hypothetical protein